jgi:hypothetical protein
VLNFIVENLSPSGFAMVATKRFYFGVGGGSVELEHLISTNSYFKENLVFSVEKSFEDGFSNIRDIIKIKKLLL